MNKTLAFALLLVISLVLISYQIRIHAFAPELRRLTFRIFSPVRALVTVVPESVEHVIRYARFLRFAQQSQDFLLRENAYLKHRVNSLLAYRREFARLEALCGFQQQSSEYYIPVKVIGMAGAMAEREFVIDAGSDQGVSVYDPVVHTGGVVGYIKETEAAFSTVRTILSSKLSMAAYLEQQGIQGVFRGSRRLVAQLHYIPINMELEVPQRVYSSGTDGIFPRNLYLGEVFKVEKDPSRFFQRVWLRLNDSPFRAKYLFVVKTRQ